MKYLLIILSSFFLMTGVSFAQEQDEQFQNLADLDSFLQAQKGTVDGKRIIKLAAPFSFNAKVKRHPEEKKMNYVYIALEIAGVDPLPLVNHRMFLQSAKGKIFPVYVEKEAVVKITSRLKVDDKVTFLAYHLYNYSKGPAFLVVDFVDPGAEAQTHLVKETGKDGSDSFFSRVLN